jgi:uncharacterized protein
MKRILSLDGGGIRGVFSLEVLLFMQKLLREHYARPDLVLADHFDFFSGTSTGAIIATCLCWGMSVEQILDLYVDYGRTMFQPVPWYRPFKKILVSRYEAKPLSNLLQRVFSEDGEGKIPALLGTKRLKKLLMVVIRNHSSGSAWPVTNNAMALFNSPEAHDCNLNIPLWKVVRASTAAPVYFDPEEITLGDQSHVFVDGSVTPYNNPALIAALTAVLPCYRLEWTSGPENLRVVSVGTMRFSSGLPQNIRRLWIGYNASRIPVALMQGIAWEQDFLCRCLGECIYGEPLDSEIGDLVGVPLPGDRWFSYVRYNKSFKAEELEELLRTDRRLAQLDAVQSIPMLRTLGQSYAQKNIKLEHLA